MTQEEFVNDPIVPIELRLPHGRAAKKRFTLYQPGWHAVGDDASAFLREQNSVGGSGSVLVFETLDDLVSYVDSGASPTFSSRQQMSQLRLWTTAEYHGRLCEYDLTTAPEIADRALTDDELLNLGSTLALALDLVDQLDLDDASSDALGDDPDIGKLTSGETVGGLFAGANARDHLRDLLAEHWGPAVTAIAQRVTVPGGAPAKPAKNPDSRLLEDLAPAVSLWFGLSESGIYTLRTTTLTDGKPRYPGVGELRAWSEPEELKTDLLAGNIALDLKDLPADVDVTPGDDMIFDLVEIGESIGPAMTADDADALVTAWTEIVRLGSWGVWQDVELLTDPDSAIGSFIVGCAIDLAQVRPGSEAALRSADHDRIRTDWTNLVGVIESHIATA